VLGSVRARSRVACGLHAHHDGGQGSGRGVVLGLLVLNAKQLLADLQCTGVGRCVCVRMCMCVPGTLCAMHELHGPARMVLFPVWSMPGSSMVWREGKGPLFWRTKLVACECVRCSRIINLDYSLCAEGWV